MTKPEMKSAFYSCTLCKFLEVGVLFSTFKDVWQSQSLGVGVFVLLRTTFPSAHGLVDVRCCLSMSLLDRCAAVQSHKGLASFSTILTLTMVLNI